MLATPSRGIRIACVGALASVCLMLMLLPSSSAQVLPPGSLELHEQSEVPAVKSEVDTGQFTIPWTYTYANEALSAGSVIQSEVQVRFTWTCPDFVIITGPSTGLASANPPSGTVEGEDRFMVKVLREAPAGEVFCRLEAAAYGTLLAGNTTTTGRDVRFIVKTEQQIATATKDKFIRGPPNDDIRFEFNVTNQGNAPVVVKMAVSESLYWKSKPDADLYLARGATGRMALEVRLDRNGYTNSEESFQVTFTATPDGLEGEPATSTENVLAAARSESVTGVGSPNISPVLVAAALVLLAFVVRKR